MKKVLLCMMNFVLVLLSANAQTGIDTQWYYDNKDTQKSFDLSTAEELAGLASLVNSGHKFADTTFVLVNDVDLTNWLTTYGGQGGWSPIGNAQNNNYFAGIFDGGGYTISGLWMNWPQADYIGFWGQNIGFIKNLTIEIDNTNTAIEAGIIGQNRVGGLAGHNFGGTISNCAVRAKNMNRLAILGNENFVGGLIGTNNGIIEDCYTMVVCHGRSKNIGGIAGNNSGPNTKITNCYTTSIVTGNSQIGGLIGVWDQSTATNCFYNNINTGSSLGNAASLDAMKIQSTFTDWDFTSTWAIDEMYKVVNQGFPYLQVERTYGVTFTAGEHFSYKVNDVTVPTGANILKALAGDSLSFTLVPESGYTVANATVKAGTITLIGTNGLYILDPILSDSTITVTDVSKKPVITLTLGDYFTYEVNSTTVTSGANTFEIEEGEAFSFTVIPESGYTIANATVMAGTVSLSGTNGLYTLAPVLSDAVITVTGVAKISPPVIRFHTVTLTTGEGIVVDKDRSTYEIQASYPFSFIITMAEGYEGHTPTVTVNGQPKAITPRSDNVSWRCLIPGIYEPTEVVVSINFTGNDVPAGPRLYSREGQLFIETAIPADLAVYSITGQAIVNRRITGGLTTIPLPDGIYIVKLDKMVQKVSIRK